MNLLTKLLIYKGLTKKGGITPTGSLNIIENGTYDVTNYAGANVQIPFDSTLNLFVQNTEPAGYNGIWIKSNNFTYQSIREVPNKSSVVATSINIVQGNNYKTILFSSDIQNGAFYGFNDVFLTDSNNDIIYDILTYYGNGVEWIDITPKPIVLLDYIESSGTQYIDTGYKHIMDKTRVVAEMDILNQLTDWRNIFGAGGGATDNSKMFTLQVEYTSANSATMYYSTENYGYSNPKGKKLYDLNKNVWTIGNVSHTFTLKTGTSSHNMLIFNNTNHEGLPKDVGSCLKLYSFKIYTDDTLIRDFIPVKDTNNVACLFDNISKQFFYNQGTGDFIAGNEI